MGGGGAGGCGGAVTVLEARTFGTFVVNAGFVLGPDCDSG